MLSCLMGGPEYQGSSITEGSHELYRGAVAATIVDTPTAGSSEPYRALKISVNASVTANEALNNRSVPAVLLLPPQI